MKNKVTVFLFFVVSLVIIFFLIEMYGRISSYKNFIYPGVTINNVDVGGLTIEEGQERLLNTVRLKEDNKKIIIEVENFKYVTNYKDLGVRVNIEQGLKDAFAYGKNLNFFSKHQIIHNPKKVNFNTNLDIDEKVVESIISNFESKINVKPINAELKHFGGGVFKVTAEQNGKKLNSVELKKAIYDGVNKNLEEDVVIRGSAQVIFSKITEEELKVINSKISTFSTSLGNSSEPRNNNIKIATDTINGTILMPGDIFSFNNVVGKSTTEKGYKGAKVIVGDEFVDGIGGGICQVSTTLYNTVIKSELTVIERRNHSQAISYVPLGQDAMIFYGASDLKFLNDTEFPIYIEGYANDSSLTFNLYSDGELSLKTYELESKIVKTLKPRINITYDSTLPKGAMITEKEGKLGYEIELYKYSYLNNSLVGKELVSKSRYSSKDKYIRTGR
jgi:vancomycin resistance protein YoaR